MTITAEKFMAFTTFRRTGDAVTTPVWLVETSDGRLGFWTAMGTGKTKRLRHDPHVKVQASDFRGNPNPGAPVLDGEAEMVQSGPLYDEVQAAVRAKYGFMTKLTKLLQKVGPQGRKGLTYADTVVLVRLDQDGGTTPTPHPNGA